MTEEFEYECALSGVSSEGSIPYAGDGMDDCPPGWVQVTLKRRLVNPKYVAIQQTKAGLLQMSAQQIPANVPAEARAAQMAMLSIQVEAQFHGVESETPPYLTYEEQVFISPPETNPDLLEAFNEVREGVGLEPLDGQMFFAEEEDAEDSDDGSGADEEEEEESAVAGKDEIEEIDSEG